MREAIFARTGGKSPRPDGSLSSRAINRQNVFRRHIGLEQVGRAKDVTATGPGQLAVTSGLGRHLGRRAVR